jgi:hypothetical protein
MRRLGLLLASAVALLSAPVSAAQFIVNFDGTSAVTSKNDYRNQLAALGLTRYANFGATLSISGPGTITFHRVAAESGFTNRFTGGSVTALETNGNRFNAPVLLGSDVFAQGSLQGQLFFTTNGNGPVSHIGSEGFGIFLPRGVSGQYRSSTLYLGFDDLVKNDDDNHDDFIVKATLVGGVPEPATWAMLILGFGLVGFAARRTRSVATA